MRDRADQLISVAERFFGSARTAPTRTAPTRTAPVSTESASTARPAPSTAPARTLPRTSRLERASSERT